jgi:hypothetical protein
VERQGTWPTGAFEMEIVHLFFSIGLLHREQQHSALVRKTTSGLSNLGCSLPRLLLMCGNVNARGAD